MSSTALRTLLDVDKLSVAFRQGGALSTVVRDVTFSVAEGEKLALVGESGSGKSVTALSILRLNDAEAVTYPVGQIRFAGEDLLRAAPARLRRIRGRQIAMVFQEPMTSLNPVYTIGRQLVEPLLVHESLSRRAARERMLDLLELTGIPEPHRRFDAYPHMLSGGQRQRVMIAMALACRPRLLIADEPTTALDVTVQLQLLELLARLQRDFGMAVLLITHDLNLVRRFADRVCVMEKGVLVEQGSVESVFSHPSHPYTRRLLDSEPPRTGPALAAGAGEPLLVAEHLQCRFAAGRGLWRRRAAPVVALDDVSIQVQRGETVGIVGESGSGKTTLGMCLLRLQACGGSVTLDGQPISASSARQWRRRFQVVFQDPYSSLSPRLTVEEIVGEGLRIHHPELDRQQRRDRVRQVLEEVGLTAEALSRYPHAFSGGQRQRIAIARAVILQPELLLLDEPTSALDVSVQKQVLMLLSDLQRRRGMSYLFITHDLKVIRAMAHRLVVVRSGRIVESGAAGQVFENPQHPYTRQLLQASLL